MHNVFQSSTQEIKFFKFKSVDMLQLPSPKLFLHHCPLLDKG